MKLVHHYYGKAKVRLMKVIRDGHRPTLKELEVSVMLQGDFAASYTSADNRLVVEGVNFISRHTKPNPSKNVKGGIAKREAALHASNVQLVCPECGKPTRIGRRVLGDGRKVRFCRKCEGVVDK